MQGTPDATRGDVLRIVRRDFRPEEHEHVLCLLDQSNAALGSIGAARVHLAILKLSEGSVERLREFVALARSDYRDVLSPAEYPEYMEAGFVGIGRMSPEEVQQIVSRDWQQYQEWLNRV